MKRVVINGEYKLVERQLYREKLKKFSPAELRIVRNTIFARYGYKFNSADLRMHFEKFKWYKPSEKNTAEIKKGRLFSKQELANIAMLKKLEDDIKTGMAGSDTDDGEKYVLKKPGEYWQKDELLAYKQFEILLDKSRASIDICPLTSYTLSKVNRERIEYGNLMLKHLFLKYFNDRKLCRGVELEPGTCDEVNLKFVTRNFIEIDNKLGSFHFLIYDEVKGPYKKMLDSAKLREGVPLLLLKGRDLRKVRPGSSGGDSGISQDKNHYELGMEGLYYLNINCRHYYDGPVIKHAIVLNFSPVDRRKNMGGTFYER